MVQTISKCTHIIPLYSVRTLGYGANHFLAAHALFLPFTPAADAQRSQPITASLPACDGRFVGEGKNGCILTWLFEKCQPLTVWSSAERLLAQCEHAHQPRSSRHGNITRLYTGCSHSNPQPSFTIYLSSLFLSQNKTNLRSIFVFLLERCGSFVSVVLKVWSDLES